MKKYPQSLIFEMLKRKIISQKDLTAIQKGADGTDKNVDEVALEQGFVDDASLRKIKSEVYKIPEIDISKIDVDKELSKTFPQDVVKFYGFIPFAKEGNILKIGLLNPEDIDALEALKFIAVDKDYQLDKYVISYNDFAKLQKAYGSLKLEVGKALESISRATEKQELKLPKKSDLGQITAEAPITRIVAVMVRFAVESRASDIHIEPFEDRIRIRFRIDGVLTTTLKLPKNLLSAIVTRVKILSDLKIDETRLPQDGRFSTHLDERKIDFRISILPTKNGEKVVMRILDPIKDIALEKLGFTGRNLEVIKRNSDKPFGQILVTGPTGSGKSTTLYSMLTNLNKEGVNITTLEDPIEYFLDGVNQSQVHEEIGFAFANGLRSILRQDPDIIMIGEIRDPETATLATQSALTGHLVLSTLHTNDSIGVVPRLIDMGVQKYLLAPTLNLAMGQRLLRKLCDSCKDQAKPNAGEEKIIEDALDRFPKESRKEIPKKRLFFKPGKSGCKECGGKSFKGRIAIAETLEMTNKLEEIILTNISEQAMRAEAFNQGMISMYQDGILKVLNGLTSLDELLQVAQSQEESAEAKMAEKLMKDKTELEKAPTRGASRESANSNRASSTKSGLISQSEIGKKDVGNGKSDSFLPNDTARQNTF